MRYFSSILVLLIFTFSATAQLVRISLDEVMNTALFESMHANPPGPHAYPANSTTYQVFAELQDPEDEVVAVYAINNCWEMTIAAQNTFWNSPTGGLVGPDLNEALWDTYPSMQYDSYVTIGRTSNNSEGGPITVAASFPSMYWSGETIAWAGSPVGEDMLMYDGTWYSLNGNVNNRGVGPNNRVLLFQITTSIQPYYSLNVQIVNDGIPISTNNLQYVSDPPYGSGNLVCSNGVPVFNGAELGTVTRLGCMDDSYCNYDEIAVFDDGSCSNDFGCTIELADNYDADAVCDDGSCIVLGCMDEAYCNYWNLATVDDGSCLGLFGCTNPQAFNYSIDAACDDGSCYFVGCMNPQACNYNPAASVDDGTCLLPDGCTTPNAVNYDLNALCDDESCLYGGCTDPLACNYSAFADIDDGSCSTTGSYIYGVVYHDLNSNNLFESTQFSQEPTFSNWAILIEPGNQMIYTDASGNYNFHAAPGQTYTLTLIDNSDVFDPNPNTQEVQVSGAITCGTQNLNLSLIPTDDYYLQVSGPCCIFMMDIHCNNGMQPGLWVHNTGSLPLNGAVTLTYDPILQTEALGGQALNPSSIAPGQTQWIIDGQSPGSQRLYQCQMLGPGTDYIGQVFPINMNIYLFDGEGNEILDNTYVIEPTVVCAYDPNDKYAIPEGYAEPHYILEDDEIEYRIRFQNTGNFVAEDINIIDTLDVEHLDLSSFTPRYASHSFMTSYRIDEGIVDFQFENIMLPDSGQDFNGSTGFVVYTIKPKSDIQTNAVIENTAYIYFEANPAIVTNTTWHTIYDCEELRVLEGLEIEDICANEELDLEITYAYIDSFAWEINGNSQGPGTSEFNAELELAGIHTIGLTASNPLCSNYSEVDVEALELPVAAFFEDVPVLTAAMGDSWQWYLNGELIDGATEQEYTPTISGFYSVEIENELGCSALSDESFVTIIGIAEQSEFSFIAYPNPTFNTLNITFPSHNENREIELIDSHGRTVVARTTAATELIQLDLSNLSSGNYILQVFIDGKQVNASSVLKK